jgi:predicted RNase H-like HicB family nuclease
MLQVEFEQEEDGRWLAEIPALPGVMAYGADRQEARSKVEVLALRTLADRLEHGEQVHQA